MEEWKAINDYPFYEVSSLGRVKSLSRTVKSRFKTRVTKERVLTNIIANTGYPMVALFNENGRIMQSIHRLVAFAFIPNPNNYPFVNHIDSVRNNSTLSNLEWCTHAQNMKHAYDAGRLPMEKAFQVRRYGKDHHNARKTYVYRKNQRLVGVYDTIRQAATAFGVEEKNARAVAVGKRHTCGGLIFSFDELIDSSPSKTHAYVLDESENPVPLTN